MSQGSFRLPPDLVAEMLKQAQRAEDARPRAARPVPDEDDERDEDEDDSVASDVLGDDFPLRNSLIRQAEEQIDTLSGFLSDQVALRQRVESETAADGAHAVAPSRRYAVLSDLLEIEAQLGRMLRVFTRLVSRERQHYGEATADVLIENAKRKRTKLSDDLADGLRGEGDDAE